MANRIRKKHVVEFDQISNRWIIEAVIVCDTVSDLPNVDEFENYHIAQGSKAIDVSTGNRYRITSSGSWKLQSGGDS